MAPLERASEANAAALEAFFAARPYDDVYVAWLHASGQIGGSSELVVSRDDAGEIDGTCYFGIQTVPSATSDRALDAFAAHALRYARSTRMIVGPRPSVERYWASVRSATRAPRAVRASQPVYVVSRATLVGSRADAVVARATALEVAEIARNSAQMIAGEIGASFGRVTNEFRERTARIVAAGWWWTFRVDGRLAFMCNVGSSTAYAAQLQGVWSPADMRGRGYARRALAAICDRLLDTVPALCLYVNDFNAPAIALYERVGFGRVGEFSTLLF